MPKTDFALYEAAKEGKISTVRKLLIGGANVNQTLPNGETPLYAAAKNGKAATTRLLLAAGANVNPPNPFTQLISSYKTDWHKKLLLNKYLADEAFDPNMISPLAAATKAANHTIMKMLLEAGANVHAFSALADFIQSRHYTSDTQEPLYLNAKTSYFSLSAMHIAAANNDIEAMTLLVRYGAKTDYHASQYVFINMQGTVRTCSPLDVAAHYGHVAAARWLLEHGAKLEQRSISTNRMFVTSHDQHAGFTSLHLAAKAGHEEMVQVLFDHGANLDKMGDDTSFIGHTPLYHAVKNGKLSAVVKLLELGAKVDKKSFFYNDQTPLEIAATEGHLNIMGELLSHGANPTAALETVLKLDNIDATRMLLTHGATVSQKMTQIEWLKDDTRTLLCEVYAKQQAAKQGRGCFGMFSRNAVQPAAGAPRAKNSSQRCNSSKIPRPRMFL